MEIPTVTSRVVAEIYRGIEFPSDWIDKPDVLNLGMARDLLVSVAAMFDGDLKPVALCWRVDGREERFVHAQPNDPDGSSLLDELHRDLNDESLHLGPADLLATMLWTPDELRADQGQSVHRIAFAQGRPGYSSSMTGWSIAARTLVARAGDLLFMTRRADDDLVFPMPANIEEMHSRLGSGDPKTLIVLPGGVASTTDTHVGRKMALLFGGLIVLGALISAFMLGQD
ncbi:hypothetical protein [Rhodanobacter sp. C05]|uniref:hypothetical protein n=1 Tax=Rhodanobacter sp. C05 TaxID=1945855 RepID=UPI0009850B0D|nr:hypothetical protein [Rhodanobacter sp. C05]OOG37063.1 hypothetical protein B0E51_17315 [Rhodanobacter sp. C05]